jgi:hypothetical protein
MMRYCGFFLGMGLGLHSELRKNATKELFDILMKITAALFSVGIAKATEFIPLPKSNVNLCYLMLHNKCTFALYFCVSHTVFCFKIFL